MILAKTQRGLEYIAASHVRDQLGDVKIEVRPNGYLGVLIVHSDEIDKVKEIPEIEKAIPILFTVKSDLNEIISRAEDIAKACLLYTSPSPRDLSTSRMPSSA